jgi:hypothetical protein
VTNDGTERSARVRTAHIEGTSKRRRLQHARGSDRGTTRAERETGWGWARHGVGSRFELDDEPNRCDARRLDRQLPLRQEVADRAIVHRGMACARGIDSFWSLDG